MKKKYRYLPLYEEWMEKGSIPGKGLCGSLDKEGRELLKNFVPTDEDANVLMEDDWGSWYWGSGLKYSDDVIEQRYSFTPLRQTIVLLMAAMNNEL
jgi:hypothetical protein